MTSHDAHMAEIIDAATRFLRTNPELLGCAVQGAAETGQGVEALLADAVERIRRSGFEAITEKQVIVGSAHRLERRTSKVVGSSRPAVDNARPRLTVLAS